MRSKLLLAAAAVLLATVTVIGVGGPDPLGPIDGHDLPAVDTGRVAVGEVAPDFALVANGGERFTLSALRGRRTVVLLFYRGRL